MQTVQFQIKKTMEELRTSQYHQQLGRNVCAAFVAQQQVIKMDTACKKIDEPVGEFWPLLAEIIRQRCFKGAGGVAPFGLADTAAKRSSSRPAAHLRGIWVPARRQVNARGISWRLKSIPTTSQTQ